MSCGLHTSQATAISFSRSLFSSLSVPFAVQKTDFKEQLRTWSWVFGDLFFILKATLFHFCWGAVSSSEDHGNCGEVAAHMGRDGQFTLELWPICRDVLSDVSVGSLQLRRVSIGTTQHHRSHEDWCDDE